MSGNIPVFCVQIAASFDGALARAEDFWPHQTTLSLFFFLTSLMMTQKKKFRPLWVVACVCAHGTGDVQKKERFATTVSPSRRLVSRVFFLKKNDNIFPFWGRNCCDGSFLLFWLRRKVLHDRDGGAPSRIIAHTRASICGDVRAPVGEKDNNGKRKEARQKRERKIDADRQGPPAPRRAKGDDASQGKKKKSPQKIF
nr:hypothetical protein [Pandoravirus massiliensis]